MQTRFRRSDDLAEEEWLRLAPPPTSAAASATSSSDEQTDRVFILPRTFPSGKPLTSPAVADRIANIAFGSGKRFAAFPGS